MPSLKKKSPVVIPRSVDNGCMIEIHVRYHRRHSSKIEANNESEANAEETKASQNAEETKARQNAEEAKARQNAEETKARQIAEETKSRFFLATQDQGCILLSLKAIKVIPWNCIAHPCCA